MTRIPAAARRARPSCRSGAGAAVPGAGRVRREERGASALEMALYMPLLLVMIFLAVQFALMYLGNQAADAAARQAARVARNGGGEPAALAEAESGALRYAAQVGSGVLLDVHVEVTRVDGETISATVTGRSQAVVPGFPGTRITRRIQGPIEQFLADTR